MAEIEGWVERTGVRLRGVARYLADHGGTAYRREILDYAGSLLPPDERERELRSNGQAVWENDVVWQTTNLVKAGWMTKDGNGTWTLTQAGREALDQYPDPTEYHRESNRRFAEWKKQRDQTRRRAWLVRGSSVLSANLVQEWLDGGYCSLAGSQLREIRAGILPAELEAAATEDYRHLKHHELKAKVDEIVSFIVKVHPGDLILTSSDQHIYVGDVIGDWAQSDSEGGRSNLRREVTWRNADAPIDYAELPSPLPARLQTGSTIVDLTGDLALIDSLGIADQIDEVTPELIRHDHLREPSEALAEELFVDWGWLAEVRELLDERRQVIFYGPPGTGKTYIAQKLAADLVGPEQVKLVQFHPAYTYEDFFEGYRPAAGAGQGTISFELKPGPLRQLVNRAREHPDQAFVLIIDEINRANLAKVFGELYFLLEYRDQAVDLLYSADEEGFTLPKNLYVIGTMNTADRSIALIDAAMRRRFAFVELSPDTEPTKSVLGKWSTHHGLGDVAARLLTKLNERIEDPDFRIGPSYFMKSTTSGAHSPARLERIWRTSLLPLLQEHHYGDWESSKKRYQLSSLLPQPASDTETAAATDEDEAPAGEAEPTPGQA